MVINHKFEDAFGDDTCETCRKNRYWHEQPDMSGDCEDCGVVDGEPCEEDCDNLNTHKKSVDN